MEENGKKRKAGRSPNLEVKTVTKTSKKQKKLQPKKLCSEEEESEFDDRGRTPSGTNLAGVVKDLRYFFSSANSKQNGQDSQRKELLREQSTGTSVTISDPSNCSSVVENVNNNTEQLTCSCKGACVCLRKLTPKNKLSEIAICDSINQKENDEDDETRFLHQLAKVLKVASLEDIKEQHQTAIKRRELFKMKPNTDLNTEVGETENNEDNRMVSSIEENDESNPQAISLASVIQMMQTMKKDISKQLQEDTERLRQDIKKDIAEIKQQKTEHLRNEIQQELDENEKIVEMRSEIAFWKIKAETMTEVCNRMHTEMADLCTRVDNLELNVSKKNDNDDRTNPSAGHKKAGDSCLSERFS